MATDDYYYDPNRIVRSYVDPRAPTAECMTYVTANGRVWREVFFRRPSTGSTHGEIRGGRIIPTG